MEATHNQKQKEADVSHIFGKKRLEKTQEKLIKIHNQRPRHGLEVYFEKNTIRDHTRKFDHIQHIICSTMPKLIYFCLFISNCNAETVVVINYMLKNTIVHNT